MPPKRGAEPRAAQPSASAEDDVVDAELAEASPPARQTPPPGYQPTRLEDLGELRQAAKAAAALPQAPSPGPPAAKAPDNTAAYRPLKRPPLALLCILDDGSDEGEWVRLRGESYVFGRNQGDFIIPHDIQMSGTHAELARARDATGNYFWTLADLNSTNGTFLRIGRIGLADGQELMLGQQRFRFELSRAAAPAAPEGADGTRPWKVSDLPAAVPRLVELPITPDSRQHPLLKADNWVGRQADRCEVLLADDPMVSPQHCRIYLDSKQRWTLENNKSRNGTWIRIQRTVLKPPVHFQLGEQRFLLRLA